MRVSALHDLLAAAGATFRERHGVEVAARFAAPRAEYTAIRDAVGLTDFSFVRAFRIPEAKGIDFLDALLAGNVAKIRFGRVLHTLLTDADGRVIADCLVANNDDEFIFLCESLLPDAALDTIFRAAGATEAGMEELTSSHVLLSVDGYKAWEVVKRVFGADVLGLPYLSIERYPFAGDTLRLFRAGKTSEFGYLLLAPRTIAPALFTTLKEAVEQTGGQLCGVDIHDDLRLEGRFFNIHAEGARVRDPLVLGLQWMIDFDKEVFHGAAALKERRAAGLQQKVIGVATAAGGPALSVGAKIYHAGEPVAEVVAGCFSFVLDRALGLAVFPVALAFSGLTFNLDASDGPAVQTISMPPIMPRSLTVKLDEM